MSGGIHVLLVDDDPAFTDLTATYLERVGDDLTTHTETHPDDALAYAAETDDLDCVVSDYNMPSLTGLELFEELRTIDPHVPFILFTGKGSEEIASDAISAGVTDYLQKESGTDQYEVLANRIENAVAQHRAERKARETSDQLEQVVSRISDAFFAVDRDWTIDFINERAASFIGKPREELVGDDLRDHVPEDDASDFYDVYRRALDTQEPVTYEGESTMKPGTWIETRVFPSEDGLSVYFRDVTDRVRMESELEDANRKITALHDVATELNACEAKGKPYDLAVEAAEDILAFDRCGVGEVQKGCVVPRAVSKGLVTDDMYAVTPLDAEDNLCAETYRTGRAYQIGDLHDAGYVPADSDFRSALSVPVGSHGVFQAVSSTPGDFTERDLELANLLLSHVAAALDRVESRGEDGNERQRRDHAERFADAVAAELEEAVDDARQHATALRESCSCDSTTFEALYDALDHADSLTADALALARDSETDDADAVENRHSQ